MQNSYKTKNYLFKSLILFLKYLKIRIYYWKMKFIQLAFQRLPFKIKNSGITVKLCERWTSEETSWKYFQKFQISQNFFRFIIIKNMYQIDREFNWLNLTKTNLAPFKTVEISNLIFYFIRISELNFFLNCLINH